MLHSRTFRHLFAAQLVALVGTGLATVALGLLAWDRAGADAGRVLGTVLAIKMVAHVTLAPVAAPGVSGGADGGACGTGAMGGRAADPETLPHHHPDLGPDYTHLRGTGPQDHVVVIDDLHRRWPRPA